MESKVVQQTSQKKEQEATGLSCRRVFTSHTMPDSERF